MNTPITLTTAIKILNSNKDFMFYRLEGGRIVDFTLTDDITRFRVRYNNKFKTVTDMKKQIKETLRLDL